MKKIITALLGALIVIMGLSLCASAAGDFSITCAAKYAIGQSEVAVYMNNVPSGTEKVVFTINGEDCEPTMEIPYGAAIEYGPNEIYATAYGAGDEVLAVTDSIEVYGNDYQNLSSIVNYDFDENSATQTIYSYTPTAADRATVTNEKINIGGTHGNVAWMKTENWLNNEWSASRPELHTPDTNWFSKATGKNTYVYELDVMPLQVGKDQVLFTLYYKNSNNENVTFNPIQFTASGKVKISTSISDSYSGAPAKPEFDIPFGEWMTIRIYMDSVDEEFVIQINDVVYSSFGFDSTSEANKLNFSKTGSYSRIPIVIGTGGVPSGKPLEFYFDNLKYSAANHIARYSADAAIVGSGDEVLAEFPIEGGAVEIVFSENMGTVSKDDIKFMVNDVEVDFEISYNNSTRTAVIVPDIKLMGREVCTVDYTLLTTLSGAGYIGKGYFQFNVELPPCAVVYDNSPAIVPGEDAEFAITIKNELAGSKDGVILVGIYKDGGLESVETKAVLCGGNTSTTSNVTVAIPEDYNEEEYEIITFFLYKNSYSVIDFLAY